MSYQSTSEKVIVVNEVTHAAIFILILYSAYKLGTWAGDFCANLSIEV